MKCVDCDTTWPDDMWNLADSIVAHHKVAHGREWTGVTFEVEEVEE